MNAKQAKKIRRVLNDALAKYALTWRFAEYADVKVGSKHGLLKNTETGEIVRGALQRRLTRGCPREMYKQVKRNVRQQRKAT